MREWRKKFQKFHMIWFFSPSLHLSMTIYTFFYTISPQHPTPDLFWPMFLNFNSMGSSLSVKLKKNFCRRKSELMVITLLFLVHPNTNLLVFFYHSPMYWEYCRYCPINIYVCYKNKSLRNYEFFATLLPEPDCPVHKWKYRRFWKKSLLALIHNDSKDDWDV